MTVSSEPTSAWRMASADGVSGLVSLVPTTGPRRRGTAAGIGTIAAPDLRPRKNLPIVEAESTRGDTACSSHRCDDDARQQEYVEQHAQLLEDRRRGRVGSVHSWELVTAVDGPGTRLTIFLNGCPLRCLYCHNPDTMKIKDGQLQSADDVLAKIKRYRTVFRATGGGVTISGGEPLLQPEFTRRLLYGAHELGVHTAIDTSGFLGAKCDDDMLDDVDLVLLDVKSSDRQIYQEVTGRALAPTIAFGDRLAAKNKPVWVRFVLVPGLTDSPENVEGVAEIVEKWPNVERLEVLPFHNMGADKWEDLEMDYALKDTAPPSAELIARVRGQFARHGIPVY